MEKNKIKLGIFCSSSFKNYPFIEGILNKKVEEIGLIISNNSGYKLPEKYSCDKNIQMLSYPIGKNLNAMKANELIIKASDCVLIIDDGNSKNNYTVQKKCKIINKKFTFINAPIEDTILDTVKDFFDTFEKSKEDDFKDWVCGSKRGFDKLVKLQEKYQKLIK